MARETPVLPLSQANNAASIFGRAPRQCIAIRLWKFDTSELLPTISDVSIGESIREALDEARRVEIENWQIVTKPN